MTRDEENWVRAYLLGLHEIVVTETKRAQCSLDVVCALVNLGRHVRQIARAEATPWEMALRRLTLATDELLAAVVIPLDADADAETLQTWLQAVREAHALQQ